MVEQLTHDHEIKGLNPDTGTGKDKIICYQLGWVPSSTVVEQLTTVTEVKGLHLDTGTGRKKMGKMF